VVEREIEREIERENVMSSSSSASSAVRQWVSDHLHDVIGYSDATIADFVLAVAKKAASRDALGAQLAATLSPGPQ
jgi:hypothetical protein